ncbi:cysteine--tRNA ligase [Aerococcaceae bacterium zg-1292]|uniref:cysteine--tRNA ligase n=1 Tax=Aerococcaceae bacterium zg-1292 TaxID=2774330 RepID=UPI00385DBCAC
MAIQLYNTLTRKKEKFVPIEAGKVRFYVCGPTVYNYIHIGNARSAVSFDTIRRYLMYRGYDVTYVSNFTDVDDKIIKAANEEGLTPTALSQKYIDAFKADTAAINILPATVHPRVMNHIDDIIQFIQVLIDKGFAYESQGDVYFKTESFDKYGQLSDQSLKDLMVGASERVQEVLAERKDSPLDFALWKQAKPGEIHWTSPWGEGRPGWHIECSVMATKHLGHTIDIHGGGQDLQFPHHENEIAQSECATGHVFANYWLHNGFVTIGENEEKMSKSLGNFVLLHDLLKEVDPMVIRYLLATVHYRRPIRFDSASIHEATVNINRLKEVHRRLRHRQHDAVSEQSAKGAEWQALMAQQIELFIQEMDNDFQAGNAISVLFELTRVINRYLDEPVVEQATIHAMLDNFLQLLEVFGIQLKEEALLDDAIQALIDERSQARKAKDFARSDAIRNQLKAQGILLDDTPQGTTWKRVNS